MPLSFSNPPHSFSYILHLLSIRMCTRISFFNISFQVYFIFTFINFVDLIKHTLKCLFFSCRPTIITLLINYYLHSLNLAVMKLVNKSCQT